MKIAGCLNQVITNIICWSYVIYMA